jgi:hypothetical protein
MANYIQIGDDPTTWWLNQPLNPDQLTGQPLALALAAPLSGTLVLSGRSASVAVFEVPDATVPGVVNPGVAAIYLPTAAGPSAGHYGYALPPGVNVAVLAMEIATAMTNGTRVTITLNGGGALVLDGATLSFVVVQPGELAPVHAPVSPVHDSSPHGGP